jgi:hypothetical protein
MAAPRRLLPLALLLTAECARVPETPLAAFSPPRSTPKPRNVGARADSADTRGLLTNAKVARKEPPTTLIEMNSWTCSVTEQKFAEVKVGDTIRCLWTAPLNGQGPRRPRDR